MCDGEPYRALFLRAFDVDVDPLMVAGDVGEVVHSLLVDHQPVADAEFLAYQPRALAMDVITCMGCPSGQGIPMVPDGPIGTEYELIHTNCHSPSCNALETAQLLRVGSVKLGS